MKATLSEMLHGSQTAWYPNLPLLGFQCQGGRLFITSHVDCALQSTESFIDWQERLKKKQRNAVKNRM